jgi:hypothetical protein
MIVMNVGAMRLAVAFVGGAVVLCVTGCASVRTTSARSVAVSSELVPSQPVVSEAASSGPASSQPAVSEAASSAPASAVTMEPSAASGSLDPALEKRLWALAVSAATSEGGTVKEAQAVRSTHAHAVAVTMSDGVQGDQPVWVVQVEGVADFVCDACFGPPGSSAPHGRFQLLIVDASTFRTLDFGLSAKDADLTQLGPVVDLHP